MFADLHYRLREHQGLAQRPARMRGNGLDAGHEKVQCQLAAAYQVIAYIVQRCSMVVGREQMQKRARRDDCQAEAFAKLERPRR